MRDAALEGAVVNAHRAQCVRWSLAAWRVHPCTPRCLRVCACLCVPGLGCMSELALVRMEILFALQACLPPDLTEAMGAV